jgi:hypothetical protein
MDKACYTNDGHDKCVQNLVEISDRKRSLGRHTVTVAGVNLCVLPTSIASGRKENKRMPYIHQTHYGYMN